MADDNIKCEVINDEAIKYDLTFKMIKMIKLLNFKYGILADKKFIGH